MTYIDAALLNATEFFCRRFQRLTGRTNIWLAGQLTNLSVVVYFVWVGLHFWSGSLVERLILGVFCSALLYLLSQTLFKVPIETYETSAYMRVANGVRNPRRLRDASLRISFLTLCVILAYPVFFVYSVLRLHIVLLAYDPLPPSRVTAKQWLRKPAAAPVPSE